MERIPTKQWDATEQGPHCEDNIRRTFCPPERFRVSRYSYLPGTRFEGTMRRGIVHVVSGCCEYAFEDASAVISAGQMAELPGGDYSLQVVGKEELVVILGWRLPLGVRG